MKKKKVDNSFEARVEQEKKNKESLKERRKNRKTIPSIIKHDENFSIGDEIKIVDRGHKSNNFKGTIIAAEKTNEGIVYQINLNKTNRSVILLPNQIKKVLNV